MSSYSISASVIYKKRTDVQNEFVESRREQTRLQEELLRKEKALRDTQIRSKHEMGKMKRSQVQQVDEFSMQKSRENHETIQQLTSLQGVESNYSGRLSHSSSQPEMIPSSRSLLSRDTRLPLTYGINLEYRRTFFGNLFSMLDSPRDLPQRIQSGDVQRNREAVPEAGITKTIHTSEDRTNHGTIPMPTFEVP